MKAGGTTMMTDLIMMTGVEGPLLLREVGLTPIDSKMTDASSVLGGELQSTLESQALMRDPSSFKVWSTGTEPTERVTTEMYPPAVECTSPDQSVSAEPSGPRRFLPTSGWRLESASSLVSPSLTLGLRTTEWLFRLAAAMMKWP